MSIGVSESKASPYVEKAVDNIDLKTTKSLPLTEILLSSMLITISIASLTILQYLASTVYGSSFLTNPLLSFVVGSEHGIGADAAEALLVIFSRLFLTVGFCWLPIAAGLSTLFILRNRKTVSKA